MGANHNGAISCVFLVWLVGSQRDSFQPSASGFRFQVSTASLEFGSSWVRVGFVEHWPRNANQRPGMQMSQRLASVSRLDHPISNLNIFGSDHSSPLTTAKTGVESLWRIPGRFPRIPWKRRQRISFNRRESLRIFKSCWDNLLKIQWISKVSLKNLQESLAFVKNLQRIFKESSRIHSNPIESHRILTEFHRILENPQNSP